MTYRKKYKVYKCTNSQQGAKRCSPYSIKEIRLIEIISNEINIMIDEKIDKNKMYDKFSLRGWSITAGSHRIKVLIKKSITIEL